MRWILSFELRFAKLWKPLIFTTRLPWRAWCRIWLRKWRHPPLCPHFSPAARGRSRQRRSQTPARPGYGLSTRLPGMVVPRGAQMVLIFQCRNRIHPVFRGAQLIWPIPWSKLNPLLQTFCTANWARLRNRRSLTFHSAASKESCEPHSAGCGTCHQDFLPFWVDLCQVLGTAIARCHGKVGLGV